MIFNQDDANIGFVPAVAEGRDVLLLNTGLELINKFPIVPVPKDELKRVYRDDNGQTAIMSANTSGPMFVQTTHPNALANLRPAAISLKQINEEAGWRLTNAARSFVADWNQDIRLGDEYMDMVMANWERFWSFIATQMLGTAAPAASEVGSLRANLTSWVDASIGFTNGYSATIAARQQVLAAGRLFQYDVAGGNFGNWATVYWNAAKKVENANAWIVPERLLRTAAQANFNSNAQVNVFDYANGMIDRNYLLSIGLGRLINNASLEGIPVIAVPDQIYQNAGHSTVGPAIGAANYSIYLVSLSTDWRRGLCLGYMDRPPRTSAEVTNLLGGVKLVHGGQVEGDAFTSGSVYQADKETMFCNLQLIAGTTSCICEIQGVTD